MAYRQTDRTRRHAEEKQVALLGAAHDLVARHGFAGAKVSAIARASHVSTGSLYSYFASREELLAAVFRRAADRELTAVRAAVAAAPAGARDRLDALIHTFTGRALRGRRMAWSLLFEPVSPTVEAERLGYRRAYTDLGEAVIGDGIAEGAFVPQNVAVAAAAVIGAISESLVGRLTPAEPGPPDPRVADDLLRHEIHGFCLRALGAHTPAPRAPARIPDPPGPR
ncbi:TetR/AcrR family transcriptional regulator [Streptomyces sp. NPDC050560]|uniref:TetR/AcrR family transcriptional regulator n=1 Tax=Streptomyces sp. NPDC050560 TaxID=3365630 RepID=UPI0037967C9D